VRQNNPERTTHFPGSCSIVRFVSLPASMYLPQSVKFIRATTAARKFEIVRADLTY